MAEAWAKRQVPAIVMGGGSHNTGEPSELASTMEMLNIHIVSALAEKYGVDFNLDASK